MIYLPKSCKTREQRMVHAAKVARARLENELRQGLLPLEYKNPLDRHAAAE